MSDQKTESAAGSGYAGPAGSAVYLIHNPSDAYTIKGPFMPCAVAVALLGNGAYGIEGTPILFGWGDWFKEQGIDDTLAYVNEHKSEIADALDSVLIGNERDREEVEATLALLPESVRADWLAKRHALRRSSLNDIGGRAKSMAARLHKQNAGGQR